MPEGDTVWRVAARLAPVLVGRAVVRFEAPRLVGPRPGPGSVVRSVSPVGKHLLIAFTDRSGRAGHETPGPAGHETLVPGVLVQVQLGMSVSWHLARPGQRWPRPAHTVRVRIDTEEWVARCFAAPLVRSSRTGSTGWPVAHLGPDLTGPEPDLVAVLARLDGEDPVRPLLDVLLDQRVAAGLGNVYKSELLWRQRLAPELPLGRLDQDGRQALYRQAHQLLRANLGTGPRVAAPRVPGGLAVYRRHGRPWPRCGTPIEMARLGEHHRSTYWCSRCQASPLGPPGAAGP